MDYVSATFILKVPNLFSWSNFADLTQLQSDPPAYVTSREQPHSHNCLFIQMLPKCLFNIRWTSFIIIFHHHHQCMNSYNIQYIFPPFLPLNRIYVDISILTSNLVL